MQIDASKLRTKIEGFMKESDRVIETIGCLERTLTPEESHNFARHLSIITTCSLVLEWLKDDPVDAAPCKECGGAGVYAAVLGCPSCGEHSGFPTFGP